MNPDRISPEAGQPLPPVPAVPPAELADKPAAPAGRRQIPAISVASWVLYDLANTIFSMGVVSLYFSLWVADQVGQRRADSVYGLVTALSMGIIFVISPLLGAMTDRARRRMPFLVVSTLVCVLLTALMGRMGYATTLALFVVANIAYQAGLQFYDALLPEVSTEENRGRVGGIGVGVGYLGSFLAVGIGLYFGNQNKPLLFLIIAISFLVFALPCMIFVKERGNPHPRPINLGMIIQSTRETIRTLRSSQAYPGLARFLIGRVFYTDSINTVISFMALFTVNVALAHAPEKGRAGAEVQANIILMFAISFAVLGGFAWGWLTDRFGPKRVLNWVLWTWMGIFILAGSVGLLALPLQLMYGVAALAGFALGGVWASDRPYMLRLTPPDRIGEFYGLYGMVGRFSAISGPILWAAIFHVATRWMGLKALQAQGLAIVTLLLMVVLSYFILRPVSDRPKIKCPAEQTGT